MAWLLERTRTTGTARAARPTEAGSTRTALLLIAWAARSVSSWTRASAYNRRIVGNLGGAVLFGRRSLLDTQILDITAAEDNVLVDLIRGTYLFLWVAFAALCAEGLYIFERDGRVIAVDVVERATIPDVALGDEGYARASGPREVRR